MKRSKYSLYLLAALGSVSALSAHAQQTVPDAAPPPVDAARVLSEDQAQAYLNYVQQRLSAEDFRTATASLWFLQKSEGLSAEMRAQVERVVIEAAKQQAEVTGIAKAAVADTGPAPIPAPSIEVLPDLPVVTLQQISSVTQAREVEREDPIESNGNGLPEEFVTTEEVGAEAEIVSPGQQSGSGDSSVIGGMSEQQGDSIIADQIDQVDHSTSEAFEGVEQTPEPKQIPEVTDRLPVERSFDAIGTVKETSTTETADENSVSSEPEEVGEFAAYTDIAIDLSASREDTNNTIVVDVSHNRVSTSSIYLNVDLYHWFSPVLSGYLELGLPVTELDSTVTTGEFYLLQDLSNERFTRTLTLGTQSIFEDRGWFYDSTLDLIRADISSDRWGLVVGAGVETSNTFWSDFFEPEDEQLIRWIGEYNYQVTDSHQLSFFLTGLKDDSASSDDIETYLTWIGARANGQLWSSNESKLDYWFNFGSVAGDEAIYESVEDELGVLTQTLLSENRVRGWGYDLGATWWTGLPGRPEFTLALAGTSKDADLADGADEGYRQTGLHSNSADIGSALGLSYYGLALAPELSNLQVTTAGVTFPLMTSSYLSFMYFRYQQGISTTALRDDLLGLTLTGTNKDIGQALDMVVSYEESEVWSTSLSVGFFEAGKAVAQPGGSACYGFFDFSYYF